MWQAPVTITTEGLACVHCCACCACCAPGGGRVRVRLGGDAPPAGRAPHVCVQGGQSGGAGAALQTQGLGLFPAPTLNPAPVSPGTLRPRCPAPGLPALGGALHGGLLLPGRQVLVFFLYCFGRALHRPTCAPPHASDPHACPPKPQPPPPLLQCLFGAAAAARWASSPTCAPTCGYPSPRTRTGAWCLARPA